MRVELIILLITVFFVANTYYDNKLLEQMKSWKKYYTMGFYAFIGISIYVLFKKKSIHSKEFLTQANSLIKYMPIDKNAKSIINPLIDLTSQHNSNLEDYGNVPQQQSRIMKSGKSSGSTKRSVSETKKKWVASNQNWTCGNCNKQLNAWFEVDHKIRLEHGGSNHINNLVALCRECHGEKTAKERIDL